LTRLACSSSTPPAALLPPKRCLRSLFRFIFPAIPEIRSCSVLAAGLGKGVQFSKGAVHKQKLLDYPAGCPTVAIFPALPAVSSGDVSCALLRTKRTSQFRSSFRAHSVLQS
jgi:hypothetical protein